MIDYYETKRHPITKKMVLDAYQKVRANKGSSGIDEQSLQDFDARISENLYTVWNRMTSGSYHPLPVKGVEIPKKSGGTRLLGIPAVSDRIAQQVVKDYLEPKIDSSFHQDSYGYRSGKNAHDALAKTVRNCGYYSWVVDLDIKGFFDNIDHGLLMKAVQVYTQEKWVVMYIERWLKVGMYCKRELHSRNKGTPQGGVISPLLANLFLHFVFDKWMEKHHRNMPFERYCDDAIIHCTSRAQAEFIKKAVSKRMKDCKLELNSDKTKIVYCRNAIHREIHKADVHVPTLGSSYQKRVETYLFSLHERGIKEVRPFESKERDQQEVHGQHTGNCETFELYAQRLDQLLLCLFEVDSIWTMVLDQPKTSQMDHETEKNGKGTSASMVKRYL